MISPTCSASFRDHVAGSRHIGALEHQPNQLACDAAAAAMQHPDDDLLPDVTSLGKADRAIIDAGLQRYRRIRHIGAEYRAAIFDTQHLCSLRAAGQSAIPL